MPDSKRQITAQEAMIKTASIEVRVLTLNGKQMTLAVFKQLKEAPIIDDKTAEIRGTPWGVVNYHPDCKTLHEHLHVVWQLDQKLYRSRVFEHLYAESEPEEHFNRKMALESACERFLMARTLEGWKPAAGQEFKKDQEMGGYYSFHFQGEGFRVQTLFSSEMKEFMTSIWYPHGRPEQTLIRAKEALRQRIDNYYSQSLGSGLTSHGIWEKDVLPQHARLQAYQATYNRSYAELETLDQLFIAV